MQSRDDEYAWKTDIHNTKHTTQNTQQRIRIIKITLTKKQKKLATWTPPNIDQVHR